MSEYGNIVLYIDEDKKKDIEEKGIREDEIRMTVGTAEDSGLKLRDADDEGIFLAKHKIADVFYYARYREEGDGFRVLDAYWHKTDVTGW